MKKIITLVAVVAIALVATVTTASATELETSGTIGEPVCVEVPASWTLPGTAPEAAYPCRYGELGWVVREVAPPKGYLAAEEPAFDLGPAIWLDAWGNTRTAEGEGTEVNYLDGPLTSSILAVDQDCSFNCLPEAAYTSGILLIYGESAPCVAIDMRNAGIVAPENGEALILEQDEEGFTVTLVWQEPPQGDEVPVIVSMTPEAIVVVFE